MIMGDETLFAAMAMPTILSPILEKLEQIDIAAAQSLRASFTKVEAQYPGFTYEMIKGMLQKAELHRRIDMTESLLRLEGMNTSKEFQVPRDEDAFRSMNERALILKKILSRIPDEIYDRRKFLETIKDIASAIKNLLDAVNSIFVYIEGQSNKQAIDQRKREFVKYSKGFSTTLKNFFKENEKHEVFHSANHLVNQTNLMMKTIKDAC